MFSLIITIISVALVAALALATLYYGGDAFNQGRADAKAAQLLLQGQQLLAAADMYKVNHGVFPPNKQAMVDEGYLKSIPIAQGEAAGTAWAENEEWVMPLPGAPVFLLPATEEAPCKRVNFRSYRMDGILAEVNESIAAQCYGTNTAALKTVVAKSGAYLEALRDGALNSNPELTHVAPEDFGDLNTALPDPDADDGTWTVAPGTDVADGGGGSGPGPDPDAPFGWCGGGELGMYPCPDPNAPVQPPYCVTGSLLADEMACSQYLTDWVTGYDVAMFNRTRYTVTVANDGTFSGIPHSYGHSLSIQHVAEDGSVESYAVGSGQTFNPVTQQLGPVFTNNLVSSYTSGYFVLNNINGVVWAPSAAAWAGGAHSYGVWGSASMSYNAHGVAPMYSPGNGNYTVMPTVVRWPAAGQSSLTFCMEFDMNETPDQIVGPDRTFGSEPAVTGLTSGACPP